MIAGAVARTALAPGLIDAVVQRTNKLPLFAEELTTRSSPEKALCQKRADIQDALHNSLTARLGRRTE